MPQFFDLARLQHRIDSDSRIPLQQLRARDSAIGRSLANRPPVQQLMQWLDHCEQEEKLSDNHQHLEAWVIALLILIAALLGISAMGGLLLSNADRPINVLVFLALFVGLQGLLLLATLISAFVPFNTQKLHGPTALFNPATLAFKRLLKSLSHTLPWQRLPTLTRLALLRWGQLFGLAFNIALLTSFWFILLFSDRSFAWSSTLTIEPHALQQSLQVLSLPWSWLVECATIDLDTLHATRYQSLQGQYSEMQIVAMRRWWPFLFCALITYGLLPRLVLWGLFHFLFKRQLNRSLLTYPGVAMVLQRINSPLIITQGVDREHPPAPIDSTLANLPTELPNADYIISWCGALDNPKGLNRFELRESPTIESAGIDLASDKKLLELLNQQSTLTIVIAVKSWEPPLAELQDFIEAINHDQQLSLLLVPLPTRKINNDEWRDWQHFCERNMTRPVSLISGDSP